MKKSLLLLVCIVLLAACERPATITNWSPINDVGTPLPPSALETESVVVTSTGQATIVASVTPPAPLPEVDLSQFSNPLPKSMKGYELVSWEVDGTWNFTLVTGTNREKTFEELMTPDSSVSDNGFVKITVPGLGQIKEALGMLPEGSEVFWGGMSLAGQVPDGTVYFTYPPQAMMDEIASFCEKNGIQLTNLSEPQ